MDQIFTKAPQVTCCQAAVAGGGGQQAPDRTESGRDFNLSGAVEKTEADRVSDFNLFG